MPISRDVAACVPDGESALLRSKNSVSNDFESIHPLQSIHKLLRRRVTYQYMAGKATAAIPSDWQSKIN
jgi:hypothetical protein